MTTMTYTTIHKQATVQSTSKLQSTSKALVLIGSTEAEILCGICLTVISMMDHHTILSPILRLLAISWTSVLHADQIFTGATNTTICHRCRDKICRPSATHDDGKAYAPAIAAPEASGLNKIVFNPGCRAYYTGLSASIVTTEQKRASQRTIQVYPSGTEDPP